MAITETGRNFFDPATGVTAYGDNGVGALTVNGDSSLAISGGTNDGSSTVYGGFGSSGNGTISRDNGEILGSVTNFYLGVGIQGANGLAELLNGSNASITATANFATATIGHDGGTGTVNIDDSNFELISVTREAGMSIGRNGTGFVNLDNQAAAHFTSYSTVSNEGAFLNVGTDSSGGTTANQFTVSNNSSLSLEALLAPGSAGNTGTEGGYSIINIGRNSVGIMDIDNSNVDVFFRNG